MGKNVYLVSNTYKSFYLFRKEIIIELSKKYDVTLVANNDKYINYFLGKNIKCIKLKNLFNNRNLIINIYLIFKFLFLFSRKKPDLVQTYTIHPNLIVSPLAKVFFAKTAVMITGMGAVSISSNKIIKILYDYLYKIISLFCDYFIYVNNHDKNYFLNKLNISKPYIQIFGAGIKKKKKFKKNFLGQKYNLHYIFDLTIPSQVLFYFQNYSSQSCQVKVDYF